MFKSRDLTAKKKPWNKGKLIGQKHPLSLKQIWSIRHYFKNDERRRDLALFNLAIDSKLRACDLLSLRVCDVSNDCQVGRRATILQQKTQSPVQFEIYIEALLVDEDLAGQVWELWEAGVIGDDLTGIVWSLIVTSYAVLPCRRD